jgi:UDP-2-acetamido-3-amino-2,3-dideoxy-glucuronate N-acetyltransferase
MESFNRIAPNVKLGKDVRIFGFVNLYGCEIGDETKIGTFVEIQKGVKVGSRCKISSHSFLCEGVTIEDEVFVGHNVTFINDRFPRATTQGGGLQTEQDWECVPTLIKKGASIGSSATLLCGITIGEYAIVGAGSVVTKNVPPHSIVAGNPARVIKKLPHRSDAATENQKS